MCGIAGIFGPLAAEQDGEALAGRMAGRLRHRGPDDHGAWSEPADAVAFGHARLSILDLSSAGHQPMESRCGRYVISFNGEIYNFQELAKELAGKGRTFRGGSDTEVLLAAVSEWGVEGALGRIAGMFAFALWDRRDKVLRLARDRMGEKPLYWGRAGKSLAFASELKPLATLPGFRAEISRPSLAMLLRFNYIPSPHTIYADTFKVRPGEMLEFGLRGGVPEQLRRVRYWSLREAAERGMQAPFQGSLEEAVEELRGLLTASVRRQMVADVPLGAFLSGGIDSSTITALMQGISPRKVKTFSIGFEWADLDESSHARAVARHLGTEHTELRVTAKEAREAIGLLPSLYDEPFADSSQIPTFLLCRLARKDVTVALTGDGADELFFGYNRYFRALRLRSVLDRVPSGARSVMGAVGALPSWQGLGGGLPGAPLLPRRVRTGWETMCRRTRLMLDLSGSRRHEDFFLEMVSHERDPDGVVGLAPGCSGGWTALDGFPGDATLPETMMYCDSLQYLPDDILVKVDRASMGVGLETRIPFLDHRICEFSWTLPFAHKYQPGMGGKVVVKRLLDSLVPRELVDRPKMGFVVPIGRWLRAECRDWAESHMQAGKLKQAGFEDPRPILRRWARHKAGVSESQFYLWNVLAFMDWREANRA